jgi:RNA polymerase sigma-70 factor (ECF subfamily)
MDSAERLIEQVLLLRCQMGDRNAFAELIKRYQEPLRYFINRLLDNEAMTEDVFQETWLTVIGKIHGLREVDAFPTWLYRIARNKVYQQLRKNKRMFELNENLAVPNDVEEDIFSADDAAKIHRCLARLNPVHKEVLLLRFLEQMSYEQMAQVIDCNIGTIRSRIYYAKIALKKEMEK